MEKELPKEVVSTFTSKFQFRNLAPYYVALGMVFLADGNYDDVLVQNRNASLIMEMMDAQVPVKEFTRTTASGKKVTEEAPLYSVNFTDSMMNEIKAYYNSLVVSKVHENRMAKVKKFLEDFQPTISLGDALYRTSFYLISNENNLAKSTNLLIKFVKGIFDNSRANNMLVDSAIMIGGQGKSTIQKGLLQAAEEVGLGTSMCHLPTFNDGVQDVFVKNEICIDDETHFVGIDLDSLNKILDKSEITIKGKYVKEWSAKSVANILVGTNFLPNDINSRRYSVRMVDENFRLDANYGRWDIPGELGDDFGGSYNSVVEWVKEGWLNLFYYCNKYNVPAVPYKEVAFDYGLQYKIKKACNAQGHNDSNIHDMVRMFEQLEGDKFDYKTKSTLKNKLYILANQLKLDVVERHKNMESIYDWTKALEIDENFDKDSLEKTYCFFHSDRFSLDDSTK